MYFPFKEFVVLIFNFSAEIWIVEVGEILTQHLIITIIILSVIIKRAAGFNLTTWGLSWGSSAANAQLHLVTSPRSCLPAVNSGAPNFRPPPQGIGDSTISRRLGFNPRAWSPQPRHSQFSLFWITRRSRINHSPTFPKLQPLLLRTQCFFCVGDYRTPDLILSGID